VITPVPPRRRKSPDAGCTPLARRAFPDDPRSTVGRAPTAARTMYGRRRSIEQAAISFAFEPPSRMERGLDAVGSFWFPPFLVYSTRPLRERQRVRSSLALNRDGPLTTP